MSNQSIRLTDKAQRQMEEEFDNQDEAWKLLDLVNAEFQSDPMSQQCFDNRIVERIRACIQRRRDFEKTSPFFYGGGITG